MAEISFAAFFEMYLVAKDFLKQARPPDLVYDSILVGQLFLMDPKKDPFDVAVKMGGTRGITVYHAWVCDVGVTKIIVIFAFRSFDKASGIKQNGGNAYGNNRLKIFALHLLLNFLGLVFKLCRLKVGG